MNIRQVLGKISQRDGPFVSFYLPIRKGGTRKEFVTTFRSELKNLKHTTKNLNHKEEKHLIALLEKIENYLNYVDTHKIKAIVIFAAKGIFEVIKLPVMVQLRSHIDTKPLISPLNTVLDENPPFIVVLIDRTKAKLIEVNIASKEAKSSVLASDVPQRIQAKGADTGRESKILRHIEDHLNRHLQKIVTELNKFEKAYPNNLLVIGAQKELVGKFKRLLPKNLKIKVVGDFGADTDDNEAQIIKKSQKIIDSYLEKVAWHEV